MGHPTNRKSFNGYVPFQQKVYSRLVFIILSTWTHDATFNDIRQWATNRNVSFKILVGGCELAKQSDDILCVNAQDGYEDLTQKIAEGLNFMYTYDSSWTHIMKIDDTDIDGYAKHGNFKLLEYELGMTPYPYFGRRVYFFNDCHGMNSTCRYYHMRHVNKSSPWFTKKYEGPFVSTAAGGGGYILKRTLVQNLSKEIDRKAGPYEDVAVAIYAKKHRFKPRPFTLFEERDTSSTS